MVKLFVVLAFALLIVIFAPLASIWSMNTLFGLNIAYTFDTWMASFILGSIVSGGYFRKS